MIKLHQHIARIVTFIVALQILNMGLFVQDFQTITSANSSSLSDHNIINSVVEYISEVVLNKVNALPESNNKTNKDLQAHKHFIVKMVEIRKPLLPTPDVAFIDNNKFGDNGIYYYQFCTEINPPPPKA